MLHFNDKSRRSVRFPLAASPAPLAGEDTALPPADLMTCHVVLAVDASGSIRPYTRAVYQSLQAALETMAKANAETIDMVYRVKLVFFNTEVKDFHPDFLAPEALLELLSEKDYQPGGGTHISKLYGTLDEIFSRRQLIKEMRKGDPLPVVITISDMIATDPQATATAGERLHANRFFESANRLVVFLGPEDKRAAALALAGDEDHLLTLDSALTPQLLAPILIGSTIMLADATHVNTGRGDSPRELAQQAKEREEKGHASAHALTDEELRRQFEESLHPSGTATA